MARYPSEIDALASSGAKTIKERVYFAALIHSGDKGTVLNLLSSAPVSDWQKSSRVDRCGNRTVAHPRQFLLKRFRVVVTDSQPLLSDSRQSQNGLDVPTACFPVISVEHSVSSALPDYHDVVQPELDKSVPPEALVTGTWLGNLHGFPELGPLDGD
jgi:hypothetical protein